MKKNYSFALILIYTLLNVNTFASFNELNCKVTTQYEPGCTDPVACNYDSMATEESGNCTYECISPEVLCPEDTEIYLCVPNTTPPPLQLQDFIPSGNTTLLESLLFNPEQSDGVNPDFTLTIYSYVIEDERGNQRACIQRFYNTNKPIEGPELNTEINICENDLWSFIRKPLLDAYRFYSDNNGTPGELLNVCEFPYSVCSTYNFGLNSSMTGNHKFWVSSFIRFTEDEICESIPVLIDVNINANPTVQLTEKVKTLRIGEYLNLKNMVTGDKSGFWAGQGVLSFKTPSGETLYYFSSRVEGVTKLYYTVENEFCIKTFVLVVKNVLAANKRLAYNDFNIYPNPAKDIVFVQLPNSNTSARTIKIIDMYGKKQMLAETSKLNELIELDLSGFSKGVYFVELRNSEFMSTQKIILK